MNQDKSKLGTSNKNVSEDMQSTDAATRKRLEYEKVAEKLKTAFKQKDKVNHSYFCMFQEIVLLSCAREFNKTFLPIFIKKASLKILFKLNITSEKIADFVFSCQNLQ